MAWAFIAHRDGVWAGVISGESTKRELERFLGSFAAKRCQILTVHNRDEYNAALAIRKPRDSAAKPGSRKT